MKKISLGGVALVCAFCSLYAQDPRERNYFYEILDQLIFGKCKSVTNENNTFTLFLAFAVSLPSKNYF